jgi:lipoate-protein ligase A
MHGEYKTPGGKLVVADFTVRGGYLADVQISGDFFLYPDDALPLINDALEGAAADATAFELEARVLAALPPEVEMLGFSPQAVAEAVVRGLIGYGDLHDA